MTTTTTRAINRALTYAIESCEGSAEKAHAIRLDFAQMIRDDLSEERIVYFLSVIAIRLAQMRHLETLSNDPLTPSEDLLSYASQLRAQVIAKVYEPIR